MPEVELEQRILFLYLNTGSGHITPARILAKALEASGNVKTFLENGFSPRQYAAHSLFEQGYHFSSMYAQAAYSLFYDINTISPVLKLTTVLVNWRTAPHITGLIKKHRITKIVCLHFALGPAAWQAIQQVNPAIPLFMVVTDPFTAHPSWFIVKQARYILFSRELQEKILRDFCILDCRVFPFILKRDFAWELPAGDAQTPETDKPQFTVLIAGGGEGLPDMVPLTRSFLAQENQREGRGSLHLVVVCGKNKGAFKKLTGLSRRYPRVNMTVYGYVHHMPQLLRQSDCVITKAGASFIMETLACQKPVIISTFIHGQELGNLRFVVQNRAGWFLRRPEAIYRKVRELAAEPAYRESIVRNIAALGIRPDIGGITDYIRETGNLSQVVHG